MDTPGYGKSDRPPEPQLMDQLAGAAADALDALGYGAEGAGPVDVLGYHTGCYVAAELAVLRPDLVRRLVQVGIPFDQAEERQAAYDDNFKPTVVQEDGSHLDSKWEFTVTNRQDGVTLERAAEHFADNLQAVPYSSWAYHAVFLYDAEGQYSKIAQPVVILNTHGGLKEKSRAIMPYLKDVRIVEIPELHHGVFDIGVEKLAQESRAFLDAEL
jgi:pimeloyl-ACP methyl ester carboxylesterase